ncbi:DUF3613 domain-containing protein [Castellaniella sp.]|uniref:DUF3613 domain-containing protein n=1 Tax=Castellaniella sp. TaxID=1955812 RepID=UPI003560DB77
MHTRRLPSCLLPSRCAAWCRLALAGAGWALAAPLWAQPAPLAEPTEVAVEPTPESVTTMPEAASAFTPDTPALTPEPVAVPMGLATRGLLQRQREGGAPAGQHVRALDGPMADKAYQRYLKTFEQELPTWFGTRVESSAD